MKTHSIKVIINDPKTGDYGAESVWVLVDDATFADYKARKSGGRYKAILDNDPLNIDKMHGDEITITLRGEENLIPIMTED